MSEQASEATEPQSVAVPVEQATNDESQHEPAQAPVAPVAADSNETTTSPPSTTMAEATGDSADEIQKIAESSPAAADAQPDSSTTTTEPSLTADEASSGTLKATTMTPTASTDSTAKPSSPSLSSATLAAPKKFTALNVNRMFLEKASPTTSPSLSSASPVVPRSAPAVGLSQPSEQLAGDGEVATPVRSLTIISPLFAGRLTSTAASAASSRLTSARLASAGKPQTATWAASPASAAKPAASLGSAATNLAGATSPSLSATVASPGLGSASSAPRFSTALNTSGRSASPKPAGLAAKDGLKNSPSLRNATLGSLNRSASPTSASGAGGSASSLAPWANVKSSSTATSKASREFPTAAEAAAVKKAREDKERAEAAEAAARHEQHLKSLDRFRGAALGSGKHWDEIDDEDGGFLDEVVEFGDGRQYKIQKAAATDASVTETATGEPVTKEDRFKDVSHDRSWPPRGPPAASNQHYLPPQALAAPPTSAPPQVKRSTVRETLDISSGAASLSLDDPMAGRDMFSGRGSRGGWGSRRDGGDSFGGKGGSQSAASAAPAPTSTAARAWGTLAVRQQALDPNAPKPAVQTIASPPAPAPAPPAAPVTIASPPSRAAPPAQTRGPEVLSPRQATAVPAVAPNHQGRAPPPHLAMQQQQRRPIVLSSAVSPTLAPSRGEDRFAKSPSSQQPQASVEQASGAPVEQKKPSKTHDQATEMLSAAERARKRREAEEAERTAERERARAKAAAIEERMRKEAEAKEAAEQEAKRKAEEEQRQKEEERRQAAVDKARRDAEALAQKAAEVWKPRGLKSPPTQAATTVPALSIDQRTANGRGGRISPTTAVSPSDGAASWRRQTPIAAPPLAPSSQQRRSAAPSPEVAVQQQQQQQQPLSPRTLLRRQAPAGPEGMANLDDVMGRIRGAMQSGKEPTVQDGQSARKSPILSAEHPPQLLANPNRRPSQVAAEPTSQTKAATQAAPTANVPASRATPAAPVAVRRVQPEPLTTRSEVPAEPLPVWNKFKVSLRRRKGPQQQEVDLPPEVLQSQKAKRAAALQAETNPLAAPYILTWEPPIPMLSMRTLNRDDPFFAKRYRKGVVITEVSISKRKLPACPAAELIDRRAQGSGSEAAPGTKAGLAANRSPVAVKLPARSRPNGDASVGAQLSPPIPSGPRAAPTEPASMRAAKNKAAGQRSPNKLNDAATNASGLTASSSADLASTRPELDFDITPPTAVTPNAETARHAERNGLAFSHHTNAGTTGFRSGAASPVNFMVSSELEKSARGPETRTNDLLGSRSTPQSATQTPLLPATGLGSGSTWGRGPLAFLDTPKAATPVTDQGHIKEMWSRPAGSAGNGVTTQNSLRDIGDDFLPSTLFNELKTDVEPVEGAAGLGSRGGRYAPHLNQRQQQQSQQMQQMYGSSLRVPQGGVGGTDSAGLNAFQNGSGSNSAPNTSPQLFRPSSQFGQQSDTATPSSQYSSAYLDGSNAHSQYGYSHGSLDQQSVYTSSGPVETSYTADAFAQPTTTGTYGSTTFTAGWPLDQTFTGKGSSTFSASSPASPAGSRMPFVNRQQHQQQQQGSYENANSGYGSYRPAGTTTGGGYRSFSPGQQQQQPSASTTTGPYVISPAASLASSSPYASRGLAPHQLQQQQQGQQQSNYGYGRYNNQSGGASRLGAGAAAFRPQQSYQQAGDRQQTSIPGQVGASASQSTAASMWQQ